MPPTPDAVTRGRAIKLGLSTFCVLLFVGLALTAMAFDYPFFAVAAVVLAVFAAVEVAWLLRPRSRRRNTPTGGAGRGAGGAGGD